MLNASTMTDPGPEPSAYREFTITAPAESRDAIAHRLVTMGSLGLIEQDQTIIVYFGEAPEPAHIGEELERFRDVLSASGIDATFTYRYRSLPDRDWNEEWKKSFIPLSVGERFVILPPWETPLPGRIPLVIDPGMAFGTGHHETTRCCLVFIERLSTGRTSFLDVGTGTGILAIAAVKLGLGRVVGVDNDAVAVKTATDNCARNGVDPGVVRRGTIHDADGSYDLIAANLTAPVLQDLAPAIARRLHPGGAAILSGILTEQEHDVMNAMEEAGLRLSESVEEGKWITLVVTASVAGNGSGR